MLTLYLTVHVMLALLCLAAVIGAALFVAHKLTPIDPGGRKSNPDLYYEDEHARNMWVEGAGDTVFDRDISELMKREAEET